MILFYGEGRLGNQIFQYRAIRSLAKSGERVYAAGLEDLQTVFDLRGSPLHVIALNTWLKRFLKYVLIPAVVRPLARTFRLLNYARETTIESRNRAGAAGVLALQPGALKSLTFIDGGEFQNADYWKTVFPALDLTLDAQLVERARAYILPIAGGAAASFVHIRRRDYLTHSAYGLGDFALPITFYRAAIRELEARVGATRLIFVTDDAEWVKSSFRDIADKTVLSSSAAIDFAVMTQCSSGIVSNSTFALAAALLLPHPELVIAPQFWLGFRASCWFPPKIEFRHPRLLYLPVDTKIAEVGQ